MPILAIELETCLIIKAIKIYTLKIPPKTYNTQVIQIWTKTIVVKICIISHKVGRTFLKYKIVVKISNIDQQALITVN